jgi:hypothetical protein
VLGRQKFSNTVKCLRILLLFLFDEVVREGVGGEGVWCWRALHTDGIFVIPLKYFANTKKVSMLTCHMIHALIPPSTLKTPLIVVINTLPQVMD